MTREPITFGYKSAWLAIQSDDTDRVVRTLGLERVRRADPDEGIGAAREVGYGVYVAAPIRGWTLCVGWGVMRYCDAGSGATPPTFPDLITRLSRELSCDAQYFATHRVVESHAWGRASDGALRRAYLYVGESGETIADVGEPTPEERELGFFEPPHLRDPLAEPDDVWVPNEEDVMRLAGRWSLNPRTLSMTEQGRLGTLGRPWWMLW